MDSSLLPPAAPCPGPAPAAGRWRTLLPLQVAYVLFLPLWLGLAAAATLGLAGTPSWWSGPGILFAWAYPVVALVGIVVAHALHARRPRAARWANLLGVPWLLVGAGLLVWILSAGGL